MRPQATAASQPACPAPTMTMSNCSVNCIFLKPFYRHRVEKPFSPQRHGDSEKPLRLLGGVGKDSFLPSIGWEIPITCAGFVVVSAAAVTDCGIAPVIHADLQ